MTGIPFGQVDVGQAFHLLFQLVVIFFGLMILFYYRKWKLGMLPLYVTLATFPHLQTNLAISNYVFIMPGLPVSAGSIVLFTSTLFVVQLIYIFKDGIELRKLCTVLVFANVLSTSLTYYFDAHLSYKTDETVMGSVAVSAFKVMLAGNFALILDLFAIPLVYESTGWLRLPWIWLRILITLSLVTAFDTFLFFAGAFFNTFNNPQKPIDFLHLVEGALLGKLSACLVLTAFLCIYLARFESRVDLGRPSDVKLRDLWRLFTYLAYMHNDYQSIRDKYSKDELTKALNGRQLDSFLPVAIEQTERAAEPLCLIKVGIDDFRNFTRENGKGKADRVIQVIAESIGGVREGSLVFRTGANEFTVVLRNTNSQGGEDVANSMRRRIMALATRPDLVARRPVTVSVGLAATDEPEIRTTELSLRNATNKRLAEAKNRPGGGGVIGSKGQVAPALAYADEDSGGSETGFPQPSSSDGGGPPAGDEAASWKEKYEALLAKVLRPPDSRLVMEAEYEGYVRSADAERVVVNYVLDDDETLQQVYLTSQFTEGPPPARSDGIITRVHVYSKPAPPPSDEGGGHVSGPWAESGPCFREVIRGRVSIDDLTH